MGLVHWLISCGIHPIKYLWLIVNSAMPALCRPWRGCMVVPGAPIYRIHFGENLNSAVSSEKNFNPTIGNSSERESYIKFPIKQKLSLITLDYFPMGI